MTPPNMYDGTGSQSLMFRPMPDTTGSQSLMFRPMPPLGAGGPNPGYMGETKSYGEDDSYYGNIGTISRPVLGGGTTRMAPPADYVNQISKPYGEAAGDVGNVGTINRPVLGGGTTRSTAVSSRPTPAPTGPLDPSQSTLSPNFAPYVYDYLSLGQGAARLPFQPFTGQRFADISPLQRQAFQGLGGLGMPSQFGTATQFATQAGQGSFTDEGVAPRYMSPYMQNVVDIQKREAQRQADIAGTQRGARYAQAGAFGGARQAIENAEAERNLQQRMGDIQETGSQSAFDRAQQQFNAERQARLQASLGLGALGQQQFGSQLQGLESLLRAGMTQRDIAQQPLDFGYQQFQESLKYPMQQAQFMQSLMQGLPVEARPYQSGVSGLQGAMAGGLSGLQLYNLLTGGGK